MKGRSSSLQLQDATGCSAFPSPEPRLRQPCSPWLRQRKRAEHILTIIWSTCWRRCQIWKWPKIDHPWKTVCLGQKYTGLTKRRRSRNRWISSQIRLLRKGPGRQGRRIKSHDDDSGSWWSNPLQKRNTYFVADESMSIALCSFQGMTTSLHGWSSLVIPNHGETYKTHTVIRLPYFCCLRNQNFL